MPEITTKEMLPARKDGNDHPRGPRYRETSYIGPSEEVNLPSGKGVRGGKRPLKVIRAYIHTSLHMKIVKTK